MTTFKQNLLNDLVAIELVNLTQGKIKMPDWEKQLRGIVLAVGPGRMLPFGERAPMEAKVGDLVSFAATAGMDMTHGTTTKIRIMRDSDIDTVVTL